MDTIEEIYRNSMQLSKKNMYKDKKYERAKNQINQYYEFLSENLSKREVESLEKLMSCYSAITETENFHCFKAGFKKGLAMVKELE